MTPPASPAPSEAPQEATPRAVRLLRPHGFIDEVGVRHHWRAGHVASSPDEVALFLSRGAPVEIVE